MSEKRVDGTDGGTDRRNKHDTLSDESDGPLVSVVIASYDTPEQYLRTALASVADQTYDNVEVVVVDSGDSAYLEAAAAATRWIERYEQPPRGVSAGYNAAIDRANGEIVAMLNDDDYFLPERLARTVSAMADGADVVFSDVYDLPENGERSYRSSMSIDDPATFWIRFFRHDGRLGSVPTSSVSVRRECLPDAPFDEDLDGGEDYHLWVRLFEQYEPRRIADPLACVRLRSDSLSADQRMMYENRLVAIDRLCEQYPTLRQFRRERELLEKYDLGRFQLFDGDRRDAREIFWSLLVNEGYYRAGVMLAISLLPTGHEWVVRQLNEIYARLA